MVCVFDVFFCVAISQAQTFQEDFEQERKDREKAHSQVAEIEQRYQHQLQSMVTQLNLTSQDLQKHKETLATTETLLHSQIEQLNDRLSQRDQQVAAIANENDHLQEEVLSKTQQVKQYKKQVDQYKEEVKAHKQVTEMQIKQVNTCTCECSMQKSISLVPRPHSSSVACSTVKRKAGWGLGMRLELRFCPLFFLKALYSWSFMYSNAN